jgi:hypothetical protein
MRWLPGTYYWESHPPPRSPFYTITVAADVRGEMRSGLFNREALIVFVKPNGSLD